MDAKDRTNPPLTDANSAKRDLRFFRGQVWPRLGQLLSAPALWISLLIALTLTAFAPPLPSSDIPISDVAAYGLSFAAIATGACFTAIVLTLGLPGADRLRRWSLMVGNTEGKSALSDLLFVLAWAATAQFALILVSVVALALGGDLPVAPQNALWSHRLGLAFSLWVFLYAISELFIVLQTLIQIGVLISIEERSSSPNQAVKDGGDSDRGGRKLD